MKTSTSILRLVVIAIVVLALGGLAGWYYFLRGAETQGGAQDTAGPGMEAAVPSFNGSTGSTNENVISTLGRPFGRNFRRRELTPLGSFSSACRRIRLGREPRLWRGNQHAARIGTSWNRSQQQRTRSPDEQRRAVLRLTDTLRPKMLPSIHFARQLRWLSAVSSGSGTVITFFTGVVATSSASTSTPDSLQGADHTTKHIVDRY